MKKVYTEPSRSGFTPHQNDTLVRPWIDYHRVVGAGFTLLELLVVIAIIGTLATLVITSFGGSQKKTRDLQRKNDLKNYVSTLASYSARTGGKYPIAGTKVELTSICNTISASDCPDDPKAPDKKYYYQSNAMATKFVIWSGLENSSGNWTVCSDGLSGTSTQDTSLGNCPLAIALGPTPTAAPLPTATPTIAPTPTPTPTSPPTWQLAEIGTFGCNSSKNVSLQARRMRVRMLSGGGGDCRISFNCCGSGGASWSGSGNLSVPWTFAFHCGETLETQDSGAVYNISSQYISVGCNDGETMNAEIWRYGP